MSELTYPRDVVRIMARVEHTVFGCWIFQGANARGYGYVTVREGGRPVQRYTHRLLWEATRGPIPKDKVLDHLCEQKMCCNPDHLQLSGRGANILRTSRQPNHIAYRTNRCKRGHRLEGDNVRRKKNGTRCCRACDKLRKKGLI